MKHLALTLALTIALASPAGAYSLSCGAAQGAFQFGNSDDQALVAVHALGVGDMLAGLLCFAGDRRCGCLSDIDAGAYGRAIGRALVNCPAGDPFFGIAFNGALEVCP